MLYSENISYNLRNCNLCWNSSPKLIMKPVVTDDLRLLSYCVLNQLFKLSSKEQLTISLTWLGFSM